MQSSPVGRYAGELFIVDALKQVNNIARMGKMW